MKGLKQRIRFGPFEVDVSAGELRRGERPVRLQEQPFQLLIALLERPGEVVTRDELRSRLWPAVSVGDFDQGLNTAVNKLREALGDSAGDPRFIETVPKRGYRFSHSIDVNHENADDQHQALRQSRWKRRLIMIAVSALVASAGFLSIVRMRNSPPDLKGSLRRFAVPARFPNLPTPDAQLVAMSPNGRHIAFIADDGVAKLWIQDLDQQRPRVVTGSEGAMAPFWSPDSTEIGFAAARKLRKVSISGTPVMSVCDMPEIPSISAGSWSPDGSSIVFTSGSPANLYTVAASGGVPSLLVSAEAVGKATGLQPALPSQPPGWITHPHFLPDGGGTRAVMFVHNGSIVAHELRSNRFEVVGPGSGPFYSPTGHLLYRSGTDLWARPFSRRGLRFEGHTFLVAQNASDPSVASDGTLVYRDTRRSQLVWFDRTGARVGTAGPPSDGVFYPALSPDDRRIGVEALENGNMDVWVVDTAAGARIRLSSHPALEVLPVWAPSGDRVAFSSYRAGNLDIFVRSVDAGSADIHLTTTPHHERVSDWSRDGNYILYSVADPKNGNDLWYLKRESDGKWKAQPLLQTSFDERAPKLSPDNRYVAYVSNESGRNELYVRRFLSGGQTWPVSTHGALQVRWSRSGRELFYVENGTLMVVPVKPGAAFEVGPATRLFFHHAFTIWNDPNYDVSADGQRILLPERSGDQEPMIRVVQNWTAESRKR